MAKKKGKVVKENHERWLLTYSDLITLLMIFFILLYAMSTADARKFESLTGALQRAFNNGQFEMITIGGSPGNPKKAQSASITYQSTHPDKNKNSKQDLYKQMKQTLDQLSKELGFSKNIIHVGMTNEGVVVTLSGSVLFYPGGTELKAESITILNQIAHVLRTLPNQIRVEGNTDNQPVNDPTIDSNWTLSALRAVSIVEQLSSSGINPGRLSAVGRGQYHPIASNATPQGRAENRRADIVILYPHH